MIRRIAVAVAVVALLAAGCGDDDDGDAAGQREVAACDDLRRRENELIRVANEALADLGGASDDRARRAAVAAGFERLVATLDAQDVGEVGDPQLARALADGAEAAAVELEGERQRFLEHHPDVVTADDEHGVAGELQNALEKVFSHLEPPRSVYRDAGLAGATDEDPDCRFVTQRGDPAS